MTNAPMILRLIRFAILTIAVSAPLLLALAARARADVFVLDIVSRKSGVSLHDAGVYNGALELVARRHGGVRVSSFHETSTVGEPGDRLVVLWRFPSEGAVNALLADPNYQYVEKLREARFDHTGSSTLQLVSDRPDSRR
ncbi:MAG TPA: hypothetical protein VEI82_15260 [Myxococcota bacterium]|nr:hypothetical protein [Myxococcota bacterium]